MDRISAYAIKSYRDCILLFTFSSHIDIVFVHYELFHNNLIDIDSNLKTFDMVNSWQA